MLLALLVRLLGRLLLRLLPRLRRGMRPRRRPGHLLGDAAADLPLEMRRNRSIPDPVLIALIGTAGAAMGQLVRGLVDLLTKRFAARGQLSITTPAGFVVIMPAGSTAEQLEQVVALARTLDDPHLRLETGDAAERS